MSDASWNRPYLCFSDTRFCWTIMTFQEGLIHLIATTGRENNFRSKASTSDESERLFPTFDSGITHHIYSANCLFDVYKCRIYIMNNICS